MTQSAIEKLKETTQALLGSDDGIELLYFIMNDVCGYQRLNAPYNKQTGDMTPNVIVWNESRRDVWLRIRHLLPDEIKYKVEIQFKPKPIEQTKKEKHPYLKLREKQNEQKNS